MLLAGNLSLPDLEKKDLLLGFLHHYYDQKLIRKRDVSELEELIHQTRSSEVFKGIWADLFVEEETERYTMLISDVLKNILTWRAIEKNDLDSLILKTVNNYHDVLAQLRSVYDYSINEDESEKLRIKKRETFKRLFPSLRDEDFVQFYDVITTQREWKSLTDKFKATDFGIFNPNGQNGYLGGAMPDSIKPRRIAYIEFKLNIDSEIEKGI